MGNLRKKSQIGFCGDQFIDQMMFGMGTGRKFSEMTVIRNRIFLVNGQNVRYNSVNGNSGLVLVVIFFQIDNRRYQGTRAGNAETVQQYAIVFRNLTECNVSPAGKKNL